MYLEPWRPYTVYHICCLFWRLSLDPKRSLISHNPRHFFGCWMQSWKWNILIPHNLHMNAHHFLIINQPTCSVLQINKPFAEETRWNQQTKKPKTHGDLCYVILHMNVHADRQGYACQIDSRVEKLQKRLNHQIFLKVESHWTKSATQLSPYADLMIPKVKFEFFFGSKRDNSTFTTISNTIIGYQQHPTTVTHPVSLSLQFPLMHS